MSTPPPLALTIAGSDCSAGAGLQADLKTFSTLGIHGLTAVTCVVAETPLAVHGIYPVEPAALQEQIRILLDTYPVGAVKTGMLGSKLQVVAVAEILAGAGLPLVVDPVMVASSGDALQDPDTIDIYRSRLLPLATLMTPNLAESHQLLGGADADGPPPREAAEALAERFGTAVLVTGGHASEDGQAVDWLRHGGESTSLASPWLEVPSAHGTGCTLSAAITGFLAAGRGLPEAVAAAKQFLRRTLARSYAWPTPAGGEVRAINQLPAEFFTPGPEPG